MHAKNHDRGSPSTSKKKVLKPAPSKSRQENDKVHELDGDSNRKKELGPCKASGGRGGENSGKVGGSRGK